MRSSLLPLAAMFALGVTISLSSTTGCSRQGEGERCDLAAGKEGENSDCADGLVCTSSQELQTSSDICCPASGNSSELACIPGTGPGTGGGGGTGGSGTGGAAGGAGGAQGGGGAGGAGATGGTGGASGGSGGTGGSGGN